MENQFKFTFRNLKSCYNKVLENGYQVITCLDYLKLKKEKSKKKVLINRVDIDMTINKTKELLCMFENLNIKATFFVRLHAKEYNPFSFENYRILKQIIKDGHEIGYHSEVIDESIIWNEPAESCLKRDIEILNKMLNVEIKGVASHGGLTGFNNLDFWKDKKPKEFRLLYEAYDTQPEFNLFNESFYISDSSWTYWKCYNKGQFIENDTRSFGEHTAEGHDIIYLLIHPDTYFHDHFYE